jgi:hypothetical protein
MAVANIKRAFNRLFILLSVVWAIYCTVIYPYHQQEKALSRHMQKARNCAQFTLEKKRLDDCLKLAKSEWQEAQHLWGFRDFYAAKWPILLALIIGLPLLIYAALRGIARMSLRIWRGYKTKEDTSLDKTKANTSSS